MLINAGIAVDHVNRLGWTALHEAIILGGGGPACQETVAVLIAGGADVNLPSERCGIRPLRHAMSRGYDAIASELRSVGAS